jgi:hypothetical protein
MLDRGIGREILAVEHDTNYDQSIFLTKINKMQNIYIYMDYFVANYYFWK